MMDEQVTTVSRLNPGKFWTAFIFGLILFICLIGFFGFSGTFYAIGLGGMGDFYVSFEKLEGKGFQLQPHIGETGTADHVPMVRNHIESATVENLHIYKDLQLPTGNWIRINVKAHQPTVITGLIQDARFVDANLAFDDLTVKQINTKNIEPELVFFENWTQNAQTVTIYNAKIVTDYLFQNTVSLNEAEIFIETIDQPDLFNPGALNIGDSSDKGEVIRRDGGERHLGKDGNILPKTASDFGNMLVTGIVLFVSGLGTVMLIRKRKLRKG